MNALWIIDLSESENAINEFFGTFKDVYCQNIKDSDYPADKQEPWFYISTLEDFDLKLDEKATNVRDVLDVKVLTIGQNLIDPDNGKIRYPFELNDKGQIKSLMVIVIGDIQSETTKHFFLPIANSLKEDSKRTTSWCGGVANVYYYGMLYRRAEVVKGKNLSDEEKTFLNQLHNSQNELNTFDQVLFFEKPLAKRNEAIKSMALAALHIAFEDADDNRILETYTKYDPPIPYFLNAGASGIYFEREVQNDREAFLLGHTLLEPFVNSVEKEFYDKDAAKNQAKSISTFNELDSENLYNHLSKGMPELDTSKLDVESMPVNPGSAKVRKVWPRYFDKDNGYVANLKANLVNKIRLYLDEYEKECLEKISENQLEWFKRHSKQVEDGIFGVFDDEHPDEHCSMQQAIEVAKQAERLASQKITGKPEIVNISNVINDEGKQIGPLSIPVKFEKTFTTIQMSGDDISERDVLDALDEKLRKHPVFMFSMFSRALLLGILLGVPFLFFLPILAPLLFVTPIVAYFLSCRHYMNELENLQERYICVCLYKLNKKLLQHYKNAIYKSQCGIRDFCKWNWEERLSMLRNCLGVLAPKEFHFEPFEDFQPLLTDNLKIKVEDKVKRVVRDEGEVQDAPSMSSGKFDNLPLLDSVPDFNVKGDALGSTYPKSVIDLSNSDKMHLIHKLMQQTAFVPQQMEEVFDPAQMILRSAGSAVLMLDVSGSMCGQPFEDLKKAVKTLKEEFNDQVRWVAFADKAVLDHDVDDDLDKAAATCGGGTSYVPAFELLIESNKNGEIDLGKLIIISDGCPWDTEKSRQKILELGCIVDVIYIGTGDEAYLKELAESTGGTLQQVEDVKNAQIQTVVEEGIKTGFKLANEGEFPFGELLRKSAIRPCMKALLVFTKNSMDIGNLCIEKMIADHGNKSGLNNWLVNHAKLSSISPGFVPVYETNIHIKSSGIDQDSMCLKLSEAAYQFTNQYKNKYRLVVPVSKIGDRNFQPDSPDILVTQLHIQPLSGIRDLAWTFDPINDKQIKNEDRFDELFMSYFPQGYRFMNIYDKPIN